MMLLSNRSRKILLFLLNQANKLMNLFDILNEKISSKIELFITYFKQNECERFKDNILLNYLRRKQPSIAERQLEYFWLIKNINFNKGRLLDVGSTASNLLVDLLPKSIQIYAVNLVKHQEGKEHRVKFIKGDIRKTTYPNNFFDGISCISTLEHIGVSGRYGSDEDPAGDFRAMKEIRRIIKKDGVLFITVPYGSKDVLPINKLYNSKRIKSLFRGWKIIDQTFLKFNRKWQFWFEVDENEAGKTDMIKDGWYALTFIKSLKI